MKIKLYKIFIITLLLLQITNSGLSYALNNLPNNLTLEYEFKLSGIPLGTVEKNLSFKNGIYHANSQIKPNLQASLIFNSQINEKSQFKVVDGKLAPISFHAVREGRKPYDRLVKFDYQNKQLHYSNGEKQPLSANTYDLGSFPFAFMLEDMDKLENTSFQINNGKRNRIFTATAPEDETLKTPAGTFKSTKIKLLRQGKDNEFFHVWLADKTHYPIKIVRSKKGRASTLLLVSFID